MRILLSCTLLLALLVLVSSIGWYSMATLSNRFTNLARNNLEGAVQLANSQDALWRLRYGFPQFLVLGDADRQRIVAEEPQWYGQIEANMQAYEHGQRTAEEQLVLAEWEASYSQYVAARPRWFELQLAGELEEAAAWRARTTTPYGATSVKSLERLIELQRQVAGQKEAEAATALAHTFTTLIAVTIGALLFGLAIVWYLSQSILKPIRHLTGTAQAITNGDLTATAPVTSRDEIGVLGSTFNEMTAILRQQAQTLESQVSERTEALQSALDEVERRAGEQGRLLAEIEAQGQVIRELSVPVLPISQDTLIMPLVGALDSARLMLIQEQALGRIEETRARWLLLDITGVPVVDSQVAQGLLRIMQSARLLGAQIALVGIRPEVAQTIVGLGLDLGSIQTHNDLQSALNRIGLNRPSGHAAFHEARA